MSIIYRYSWRGRSPPLPPHLTSPLARGGSRLARRASTSAHSLIRRRCGDTRTARCAVVCPAAASSFLLFFSVSLSLPLKNISSPSACSVCVCVLFCSRGHAAESGAATLGPARRLLSNIYRTPKHERARVVCCRGGQPSGNSRRLSGLFFLRCIYII